MPSLGKATVKNLTHGETVAAASNDLLPTRPRDTRGAGDCRLCMYTVNPQVRRGISGMVGSA